MDVVKSIRFAASALPGLLAALLVELGEQIIPATYAAAFPTGSQQAQIGVSPTGYPDMDFLAFNTRLVGVTWSGAGATASLSLQAGGRAITNGAILPELVLPSSIRPYHVRPYLVPYAGQAVAQIVGPAGETLSAGAVAIDGFVVTPEIAKQVRELVGNLRMYALTATVAKPSPNTPYRSGPFEPNVLFRASSTDDGTSVRVRLARDTGDMFRGTLTPANMPTPSLPHVFGGVRGSTADSLYLDVDGLAGVETLAVVAQGAEYDA